MLFNTRLILASAAVSVLFVFAFVSRNLRAEHTNDAGKRSIDLANAERSAGEPTMGEPSSSAQRRALADKLSCTPEAGPCDQANGTPGCDDSECCNSVCDLDPYCCDVAWDELCAGPNDRVPGASCVAQCNGPGQPCIGAPDIIVVGIGGNFGASYREYGVVGDIAAFSSGTTACNMGTEPACASSSTSWVSSMSRGSASECRGSSGSRGQGPPRCEPGSTRSAPFSASASSSRMIAVTMSRACSLIRTYQYG